MPFVFEFSRRPGGRTLTDLLAEGGPLALDVCLRHATEIAGALRELHQDGRAHGGVSPAHVLIRHSGATLLPAERRGFPDPLADVTGFGGVLYAMLTGQTARNEDFRMVPAKPGVLNGPAAIRAAATRLAEKCLAAERETAPTCRRF